MSKIFDGLLNVYAFAWFLITRSAFGMYACVALMALMLGLFVISFSEQLRLAKKKKEAPPVVFEELPKTEVEEEKPKTKPKRIYPHYDDVEVVEYRQSAEGSLREELRDGGWKHVFAFRNGVWVKSHRISPGGVRVPFVQKKPNNRKPLRYCSTATWSRWHVCRGHNCTYTFKY